MKDMTKKGFTVGDMLPLGITIVVLVIALSLGLTVLSDFQEGELPATETEFCNASSGDYTGCSASWNGSGDAITSLTTFTDYIPTIALVIVVAIIIGVVVRYLMTR